MPKKATFDHTHPTLRKPINYQQKKKSNVTLRKRPLSSISNIIPLETFATPGTSNFNFIKNQEETAPKCISSLNKALRPIFQPIIYNTFSTLDNDSDMEYPSNQNEFIRTLESTEDVYRISNDTRDNLQNDFNDNFLFNSDKEEEHFYSDEEGEHFYSDDEEEQKKYYDINAELLGYTGNSEYIGNM